MRHLVCYTAGHEIELVLVFVFFFNDTAPPEIYTLSLHDALPILALPLELYFPRRGPISFPASNAITDRKSTRLNSSHPSISYAVFCLKKKTAVQAVAIMRATSA